MGFSPSIHGTFYHASKAWAKANSCFAKYPRLKPWVNEEPLKLLQSIRGKGMPEFFHSLTVCDPVVPQPACTGHPMLEHVWMPYHFWSLPPLAGGINPNFRVFAPV